MGLYKACCCCFPLEPDSYVLTTTALKIKSYTISRMCSVRCVCLGGVWKNDIINLERIRDIDTTTALKGCAVCAERKCLIQLATRAGNSATAEESQVTNKELFLNADEGQAFAERIREAMDERRTTMASSEDTV